MSQVCKGPTRPTPTIYEFQDNKISQKVLAKEKHVLEQDTLLYRLRQSNEGKKFILFSSSRAPDCFLLLGESGLFISLPRN